MILTELRYTSLLTVPQAAKKTAYIRPEHFSSACHLPRQLGHSPQGLRRWEKFLRRTSRVFRALTLIYEVLNRILNPSILQAPLHRE